MTMMRSSVRTTMMTADNLSNAEYHAQDAISSSDVKMVHKSTLAHWKARGEFKGSITFDIGSVVHDLVLEGGRNSVRGPADRRGNTWKDAYADAQAEGKTLLTMSDYDLARNVADSVLFHPAGQRMAGLDVINEASFFATDPATGLEIKCRPDSYWQEQGVVYDIKTCQDASPRGVAKQMIDYGYAIQAAFYLHVLQQAGMKAERFVFVNVEKTPPYAVSVNELSEEFLAWGQQQMHKTLSEIKNASDDGYYPTGWSDRVNVIELPRWLHDSADFTENKGA